MAKGLGTCASCRHFRAPKQPPEGADVSRDVTGVFRFGDCRRFPSYVRREPADACGEHQKG